MSRSNRSRRSESNRNSRIVTKFSPTSYTARVTRTERRDEGSLNAVAVTDSSNASAFVMSKAGTTIELNGHEARTLFLTLQKHYENSSF